MRASIEMGGIDTHGASDTENSIVASPAISPLGERSHESIKVKRILVVDDEPAITRLLKYCLERTGRYVVCEENKGRAALSTARAFQRDLILLDIRLADCSGCEVAEELRSDRVLQDRPILFLTAAVLPEELEGVCGMLGGRCFLPKPVKPRELIAVIDRLMTE